MRNGVPMSFHQGYDAKAFCKDAVSNWLSAKPELLEWGEKIHNSMSILADRVRKEPINDIEAF